MIVLLALMGLGLLSVALLSSSKVQNKIVDKVASSFSEKLNTKVSVGDVHYKLFNTFKLNDFYIEDLNKDTLLYVERAYAKFSPSQLFHKQLVFHSIKLDDVEANLRIFDDKTNNLQFLIDAFKKPDKDKTKESVQFNFKNIELARSSFRIKQIGENSIEKFNDQFNPHDIFLKDIQAKISIDYLKADSIAAKIHSLSMKEQSGLHISNLSTEVYGLQKAISLPYFSLMMPHSKLQLDSVQMQYDSIADFRDFKNLIHWQAKIKASHIHPKDLSPFLTSFKNFKDPISIQANIDGYLSSFQLDDIELKYKNTFQLKADIDLNGLPNIEETFIYANIQDLNVNRANVQDLVSKFTTKPIVLPVELARLGEVKYKGNITGFFSNLVAYGNINTQVGYLNTDILLKLTNHFNDLEYSGSLNSSNFNLGKLLDNNTFGEVAFKVKSSGSKLYKKSLRGVISGDIASLYLNNYIYNNIDVDGKFDGSGFEGELSIDDENIAAHFNGVVDLTEKNQPFFNFDLLVDNADIAALHLIEKYENSKLSFRANTHMVGNSLDNVNGFMMIDNIRFTNNEKEYAMNLLLFESEVNDHAKFTITSDVLSGNFEGDFSYSTLPNTIIKFVQDYLPSMAGENITKKEIDTNTKNQIDFNLKIYDTTLLSEALELPVLIESNAKVKGFIHEKEDDISLLVDIPNLKFGKRVIEDIKVDLNNISHQLNLSARGGLAFVKDQLNFDLNLLATQDSVFTHLAWHNVDSIENSGSLHLHTNVFMQNNQTLANTNILPSEIIMRDSTWRVQPSRINFLPNYGIDIQHFRLQNENQYILVDGILSQNEDDKVEVETKDLAIGWIIEFAGLQGITIDGNATGTVSVGQVLKKPIIESNLFVKSLQLNNTYLGDANLYTGWHQGDTELLASAEIVEDGKFIASANGVYTFGEDQYINFLFDANALNIAFLDKWLGALVDDIQGTASGQLRMFGPVKELGFEGDIYAQNASFTIDYLQTRYHFTDTIRMRRESISLDNITIYDAENNSGIVNGKLTHTGMFDQLKYDLKLKANNVIALNTKVTDNDFFYGKAYATGDIHIHGNDKVSNIDIVAKSEPRTKVYISAASVEVAKETDFITFVNYKDTLETEKKSTDLKKKEGVTMNLTMNLEVTPDAEIQLIISPQDGDMIAGRGEGNLRLILTGDDDFKMYGGVTIDRGSYLFTLQNLIRKQFKIEKGGTIVWTGDPMEANLDIYAKHSITASLYDLMSDDVLRTTDRTSVPVDAVLHITENLSNPSIKFDVDLPSSDETLKMQVRNLINTDEMMNRQIIYLLIFGKFYTPEYNRAQYDATNNTFSNFSNLASSAAFGQLNNYLSQLFSNLTLGVNIRSTGYGASTTQEYETAIMYQPNNRLIVNGNFGYRDDNYAKNKIIGDVDVEYLLSENSKWRLKAYNHTVDRYSLKSALFIQGLGIMYKQDFNSFNDLFMRYKSFIKPKNSEVESEQIDALAPLAAPDSINFTLDEVNDSVIIKKEDQ